MSDIDIFLKEIASFRQKYKNILGKGNYHEQIQEFEKLIKENNTDPEFILNYLELKEKIKDENFENLLQEYQVCIFYEKFNSKFGATKKKENFFKKINELFIELINISLEKDEDIKLVKIIKVINKNNKKYSQNFPIFYSINKELYFNSLIY